MPKPANDDARRKLEEVYANLLKPLIAQVEVAFPASLHQGSGMQVGEWHAPHKRFVTFIFASESLHLQAKTAGDLPRIRTMLLDLVAQLNASHPDIQPVELGVNFADMDAINAGGGFQNFFR